MERLDLIWQVTEKAGTMDVLNTPRRRLSESSALREGKPHVRFDVAGDENQNKAMAFTVANIPGVIP